MSDVVKAGTLTADGAILNGKGWYHGIRLTGDGTNSARAVVYDNGSAASGTVIDEVRCGANESRGEQFAGGPLMVQNGIYVDVTTPGRATVWYQG